MKGGAVAVPKRLSLQRSSSTLNPWSGKIYLSVKDNFVKILSSQIKHVIIPDQAYLETLCFLIFHLLSWLSAKVITTLSCTLLYEVKWGEGAFICTKKICWAVFSLELSWLNAIHFLLINAGRFGLYFGELVGGRNGWVVLIVYCYSVVQGWSPPLTLIVIPKIGKRVRP